MNYKTLEEVLSISAGNYDSKHINNTSNKPMPQELIDEINAGNVTTEVLDDFIKKGYHIYKYSTQLTIHGTFDDELQRIVNGYVSMVINKNGSLGVRWIAIDAKKKNKIYGYLREVGWLRESNSQEHYAYMLKQIKSKDDPIIEEYKSMANRINRDLFTGSCYVQLVRSLFGVFVMLKLNIKSIRTENVMPLIENVSGLSIQELDNLRSKRLKEEGERRAELDRKWKEDRAKREEEEKRFMENANADAQNMRNELLANGYVEGDANSLKKGDTFTFVGIHNSYDYRSIRAYQCNCVVTMVRADLVFASDDNRERVRISRTGYDKIYVKKQQQQKQSKPKAQAVKETSSELKIVDYSEKSIALVGNTKPIKDKLAKLNGRFNPRLSCGAGWIFPKTKESELRKAVGI